MVAAEPFVQGDFEVNPVTTVKEPAYEMVGKISYLDTSIIKKNKKDPLPKTKIPTDSANCGEYFFE